MAPATRVSPRVLRSIISGPQTRYYSAPVDGSIPAAKQRFVPTGGSYPKGFVLASGHAGVKASNKSRDDVAVIASDKLSNAVGYFTKNKFAAAPVHVSKQILGQDTSKDVRVRGVVINSGCANAVTGTRGHEDAVKMVRAVDEAFHDETKAELGADAQGATDRTLVMSTGVIGQTLPIDKIINTIPQTISKLGSSHDHWLGVAKAVMTTDTFPKLVSRSFTLPSDPSTTYSIAGFSKGAGMIHPNMATMLSVICTDIRIDRPTLQSLGKDACFTSFNSISIDGDTSTNDSLVILANGAAAPSSSSSIQSPQDTAAFASALSSVAQDLAKLVVRDGEGATKFVSIHLRGAAAAELNRVGRTIAVSPLVKTALYGKDANWGRILCAIGNVPELAPRNEAISVAFGVPGGDGAARLQLVKRGQPLLPLDEELARTVLEEEDVHVYVDLDDVDGSKKGEELTVWTCDFSHEYVTINGDYRT